MLKKLVKSKFVYLAFGIIFFLIFAYDIENDRDFWTWLWFLNAQLNFMSYFHRLLKDDEKPLVENVVNSNIIIKR